MMLKSSSSRSIIKYTRRLLSSNSSAAPTALQDFQFPPRNAWDVWYSAANAGLSLLTDQKSRDNFVAFANKGIINPQVLAQADLGYSMTLALYNDLSSPYLRDINMEEFLEGVKPALENFEETLTRLESRDLSKSDPNVDQKQKDEDEKTIDKSQAESQEVTNLKNWESQLFANLSAIENEGAAILNKKLNWKNQITIESSLESDLYAMMSEQCFDSIQKDPRRILIHANQRMKYQEDSGEIKNVALLSARAMEVLPDDESEDKNNKEMNKNDEKMMEDSSFSNGIEKPLPIAAQMEVLYSVAQTFTTTPIVTENMTDDDTNKNESDNKLTVTSVWVAVLRGWLRGDPSGNEELRWKLVMNRPAIEFASL